MLPDLILECAFESDPTEPAIWTDISDFLRGVRSSRGRNHERDRIQTGRAVVALDNRDGRFVATNDSGPYFPNVLRTRRIRLQAEWDGVVYPVWDHYVERWPQSWPMQVDALAAVPTLDGFSVLANSRVTASYPQQRSDERILAVLGDSEWIMGDAWRLNSADFSELGTSTVLGPVPLVALDIGNSEVQSSDLEGSIALAHIRDVEKAEQGFIFIGRDGTVTFHNRHHRLIIQEPSAVFGDGGGDELPYSDLVIDDDTPLLTRVEWQRQGGSLQVADDSAAIARHFPRTDRETSLLLTTDTEVLSQAQGRLNRYKDAGTRVDSIVIQPTKDPNRLWPVVLGLELGQTIRVLRRPPGGGFIDQFSFVESIEHEASPGAIWTTRLQLSPADSTIYWLLQHPDASRLGETTHLAY